MTFQSVGEIIYSPEYIKNLKKRFQSYKWLKNPTNQEPPRMPDVSESKSEVAPGGINP